MEEISKTKSSEKLIILLENRCKELGVRELIPREEALQAMGLTIHGWNKVLKGDRELTASQVKAVAFWLATEVTELI